MTPRLWLVGGGGLLGSAVARRAADERRDVLRVPTPWGDVDACREAFREAVAGLALSDAPSVAWCAGAGVTGSTADVFDAEHATFMAALAALEEGLPPERLRRLRIFLASSAGAVYAGVEDPPYDERSPVRPLAPYGHAKLRLEDELAGFAARTGARAVIGRISNLYGPGQDLRKAQGLVTTILLRQLRREPVIIFVPLDTVRDYLYSDDAARLVLGALDRVGDEAAGSATIKILASGQRTTIASLTALAHSLTKRRPLLVQGASPQARVQARDLSMRSIVWPALDEFTHRTLPDGMNQIWLELQTP